ncbi:MAG: hypothetical protein KF841_13625 [Phycisphaerae bacterium]|nr:hypothetical protein [Phycisphaerae bacterium]
MTPQNDPSHAGHDEIAALEKLPHDELLRHGRDLGLELSDDLSSVEVVRRVAARRQLIAALDRDGLMEVLRWARRSVADDATKERIILEIRSIDKTNYDALSRRGLETLARLRNVEVRESDSAESVIQRLQQSDGFWARFHRKRRRVVGSWLARIIDGEHTDSDAGAGVSPTVPPIETASRQSLKRQIEDLGVVGGIAQRLRGAADDYIKVKLDEIEARIDLKLNEIDQRLAEWRDREVANRLKILRITLGFTVLVAILSLAYNFAKSRVDQSGEKGAATREVKADTPD